MSGNYESQAIMEIHRELFRLHDRAYALAKIQTDNRMPFYNLAEKIDTARFLAGSMMTTREKAIIP